MNSAPESSRGARLRLSPGNMVLGAVVVFLASYLLWPQPATSEPLAPMVLPEWPPAAVVAVDGDEWQIDGNQIGSAGYVIQLQTKRLLAAWQALQAASVQRARQGLSADAFAGFSLNEPGEIRAADGTVLVRWGQRDGVAWWWTPERTVATSARTRERFVQAFKEARQPTLLPPDVPDQLSLTASQRRLTRTADGWRHSGSPQEAFDGRVASLMAVLAAVPIRSWAAAPDGVQPMPLFRIERGNRAWEVALIHADQLLLQCGQAPPQVISPTLAAALRERIADLSEAWLADYAWSSAAMPTEVVVERDGQAWYRVQRDGSEDYLRDGSSAWRVTWEGGDEPADPSYATRLRAAIARLELTEAVALPPGMRPDAWPMVAGTARVTVSGSAMPTLQVDLAGNAQGMRVWSGQRVGRVVTVPPLLAELMPEQAMETRLVVADARRIERIQRLTLTDEGDQMIQELRRLPSGWQEVWLTQASGTAQPTVTQPARSIADEAITRLLAALNDMPAEAVAAAPRAAPQGLQPGQRLLSVRIAAADTGVHDGLDRPEEMLANDRWWRLEPVGGDSWTATAGHRDLVYTISAAQLGEWWRSLGQPGLIPMVPSQVDLVEWRRGDQVRLALVRGRDGWTAEGADGLAVPVVDAAIDAWLARIVDRPARPANSVGDAGAAAEQMLLRLGRRDARGSWQMWQVRVLDAPDGGEHTVIERRGPDQSQATLLVQTTRAELLPDWQRFQPVEVGP